MSAWYGLLAALSTGALFLASLDIGPVGPVVLIAPVPLLVYALRASRGWQVGVAAVLARLIGALGLVYAYPQLPKVPFFAWLAIQALTFGAVVLLTRWVALRRPAWLAVLAYPLLLTMVEFLFGLVSPHGSFGAMGYSIVDLLPLLQVTSLGGIAALSFSAALIAIGIAGPFARPRQWRAAALAAGLPVLAMLLFGALRLTQDYSSHARVGLLAIDSTEARAYRGAGPAIDVAHAYAAQVQAMGGQRPEYVVLPEKQFGGGREAATSTMLFAQAAQAIGAPLIAGFDETLPDGSRVNAAQWLEPGEPVRRYLKRRLIPGLELGYSIGDAPMVSGTRGVAICKDLDFPALMRGYGRAGVQLLLVPAWDFRIDGRLHSRMAVVRGVENGYAIARAASAGRLALSDRYGRIVAEAITTDHAPASVVADLGLRGGGTIYSRIGDAFGWLCVAGAALLMMSVFTRRRTST